MPIGVPLYSVLHRQNGIITIKIRVSTPLSPQCVILRRVPYAKCPFLGLTLNINVYCARAFIFGAFIIAGPVASFGQFGRAKLTHQSQLVALCRNQRAFAALWLSLAFSRRILWISAIARGLFIAPCPVGTTSSDWAVARCELQ